LYPEDGVPYYVSGPEELVRELPQPKTPEEAADVANQHIDEGADLIKLRAVNRFDGLIFTICDGPGYARPCSAVIGGGSL
jgi:hypothetical protein